MDIKISNKTENEISFSADGINPAFANELRRIMVSEIPTLAIAYVEFKKNDSALVDEVLTNRLGQIPFTFKRGELNLQEECPSCKGKGCSNCQVKVLLKVKGPGVVYSGELKTGDKDIQPVSDKIAIVELFEGDELQFEATAKLGMGRQHAKWQGAVVGYKYSGDKFTFNVESVCGLSPEDVVNSAVEILENKLIALEKGLKKLK